MLDDTSYEAYLRMSSEAYEQRCRRCGACCGAFESDPCSRLKKSDDGHYLCSDYENRAGMQKTISGRVFMCVPVRKILFESWSGSWNCAYKKHN